MQTYASAGRPVLTPVLAHPSEYALAPAVVVTQTLVELSGMVVLTRIVLESNSPEKSVSR